MYTSYTLHIQTANGVYQYLALYVKQSNLEILIQSAFAYIHSGMTNYLDQLAVRFGSDKRSDVHDYTRQYFHFFNPVRDSAKKVLEIGVYNGASLKMWQEFFSNAAIFAIDCAPAALKYETASCKIFIGDQANKEFLADVLHETGGGFDIVIDDGGHRMNEQITSFLSLFPALVPRGIYAIEDLHTSYWPNYGGGFRQPGTTIEFLKELVDDLNLKGKSGYGDPYTALQRLDQVHVNNEPLGYFAENLLAINFYKSLAFIQKK